MSCECGRAAMELLDDEPVNEEIWKLPEDKEVEKILTS